MLDLSALDQADAALRASQRNIEASRRSIRATQTAVSEGYNLLGDMNSAGHGCPHRDVSQVEGDGP